jgi:hypothetical protein
MFGKDGGKMMQRRLGLLWFIFFICGLFLTGCGPEIARVSIQSVGHYQLIFKHDGTPVDLWTDFDVEYIEDTEVWYEIQFFKPDDLVQELTCSPFNNDYKLMARQTEVRGVTKESFMAPMVCDIELPEGKIRAEIDLKAEGGRVRIFRADLVINVKE